MSKETWDQKLWKTNLDKMQCGKQDSVLAVKYNLQVSYYLHIVNVIYDVSPMITGSAAQMWSEECKAVTVLFTVFSAS